MTRFCISCLPRGVTPVEGGTDEPGGPCGGADATVSEATYSERHQQSQCRFSLQKTRIARGRYRYCGVRFRPRGTHGRSGRAPFRPLLNPAALPVYTINTIAMPTQHTDGDTYLARIGLTSCLSVADEPKATRKTFSTWSIPTHVRRGRLSRRPAAGRAGTALSGSGHKEWIRREDVVLGVPPTDEPTVRITDRISASSAKRTTSPRTRTRLEPISDGRERTPL